MGLPIIDPSLCIQQNGLTITSWVLHAILIFSPFQETRSPSGWRKEDGSAQSFPSHRLAFLWEIPAPWVALFRQPNSQTEGHRCPFRIFSSLSGMRATLSEKIKMKVLNDSQHQQVWESARPLIKVDGNLSWCEISGGQFGNAY